jgi:DNA-nicking Smr family endonuclease
MGEDFGKIFEEWEKNNKIQDKDYHFLNEKSSKKSNVEKDQSIDLHGLTKSEALSELKKFIDKNRTGHLTKIVIIHGVGRHSDGKRVLKEAVKEWLSENRHLIRNFRPAGIGEGSGGATIAFIQPK